MIMCGCCGNLRHYEDECHTKYRVSQKHEKAEEVTLIWEGIPWKDFPGKGNPSGGGRSSAPCTGGREQPNLSPSKEKQGKKQAAPPSSPTAGGPKKSKNGKKKKLSWHSKCLMKAEMEVKFPAEGSVGGSEEHNMVF